LALPPDMGQLLVTPGKKSFRVATSPMPMPTAWGDAATLLVSGVLPTGAAAADLALCRQNRLRQSFRGNITPDERGSQSAWSQ